MADPSLRAAEQEPGLADLVRRLSDDSRRLAGDEVRLAKLEVGEGMHSATRGAMWLGVAFGAGIAGPIGHYLRSLLDERIGALERCEQSVAEMIARSVRESA